MQVSDFKHSGVPVRSRPLGAGILFDILDGARRLGRHFTHVAGMQITGILAQESTGDHDDREDEGCDQQDPTASSHSHAFVGTSDPRDKPEDDGGDAVR
jgi:hypothetical protein